MRVSCQYDLGSFSGPGDDRFHFMRSQILGFIHEQVLIGDAPTPDVGQGFHHQKSPFDQFLVSAGRMASSGFWIADKEFQVIKNRLHPRCEFFLRVSGKIAQIPSHRENRPGDQHPGIEILSQHQL